MNERRQSLRVDCEIPSQFRNLDPGFPFKMADAIVRNISRGGVCIRVDEFVPIQCPLHFYLSLPDHEPIEVQLVSAWIVEVPNLGKYEIGARFVEMSAEQEDAIQNFQYQELLKKIPSRHNVLKEFQKEPPRDPGLAA